MKAEPQGKIKWRLFLLRPGPWLHLVVDEDNYLSLGIIFLCKLIWNTSTYKCLTNCVSIYHDPLALILHNHCVSVFVWITCYGCARISVVMHRVQLYWHFVKMYVINKIPWYYLILLSHYFTYINNFKMSVFCRFTVTTALHCIKQSG